MAELYYSIKEDRVGTNLPSVAENRLSPDRESMLYSYQNTVEQSYAGDFRVYAKKFGDYLKDSKSKIYDPVKNDFIDVAIKYSAPQLAFSDNLPQNSTGVAAESSLTQRPVLPMISYHMIDVKRDDSRAVDPCVRSRVKPIIGPDGKPKYSRAYVTHSPIPVDIQFQVDVWTEFRDHYYQLLTAFINDFNPYSYLYDVYDIEDPTQKLQYTSYVPMFLDSSTDSSNFVPGSDRRLVRGTLRITVKGWLTPPNHNKPYVHDTKFTIETETAQITAEDATKMTTSVKDTIQHDTATVFGRAGNVRAAYGDYSATQIAIQSPLGASVQEALDKLASDVNVKSTIMLGEALPANTCFYIKSDGKAYAAKSISSVQPYIDGITLESGGIGSTISVGKQIGGTYTSSTTFSESSPLYLSQTGSITNVVPSIDTGDNYLCIVGRAIEDSSQFIFKPTVVIKLN